jgi:hypothetical protein
MPLTDQVKSRQKLPKKQNNLMRTFDT